MPDIDIDFDDEGRQDIINYVVDKHGKDQVAQIITYGSMAAKSAIRDVARVMDFPLRDTDKIAKLVPDFQSLKKILHADLKELSSKLNSDQLVQVKELKQIQEKGGDASKIIDQAEILEGSLRNTGIHACGVIITPEPLDSLIPVAVAKDADLLVTQFDNKVVEDAGMLKMDFLGLKTLTIIKHAIQLVKERHGVIIDSDEIPLDDKKTYELYQKGETNGTFQFESAGMQKHLKNLKPTNIEDLIAMNALFRPGPMQFIDTFIARKHGREEVEYPHPKLEEILKDTYGIMVYQEQIMQTAQILGGYSLGQADLLRRAMGKKKKEVMEQQKEVFRKGCEEVHQIPAEQADEIFDVMAKFAEYGFNRSHSAAYSVVAFQTAYLKANYPAEYMSAVLTNNMNDLKKVTFFMEECRRFGVKVLGPDLNESSYNFTVNKEGQIRFGLGAIKGVGEGAVEAVVNERKEAGDYKSVFDLTKRVDLRSVNKRALENMALGGALDSFGKHRAQYFQEENNMTQIEKALRFGSSYQTQQNSSQASLFGESIEEEILEPQIPETEAWGNLEELSKEKEVVGIFISGNPLDDYRLEIKSFCTPNFNLGRLKNLAEHVGREFRFAGVVSDAQHRTSKNGKPYGVLILEDYDDSYEFRMFGEEYLKFKNYLTANYFLYCTGKVEFNEWRQDTRFVFTNIELLNELMDKRTKALEIGLNLHNINEGLICDMKEVLEREKGSCKVKFIVRADEKMYSELKTKEISVRPTAQLIEDIKALNVDEVKLKS
jgi:DNA polymerase-3 subunit alpha